MIRKKIISISLLCLFLLVNGHNIFFHAHTKMGKQDHYARQHHHDHSHSTHQHSRGIAALWDWITQELGDFEHPDQGDKHLELFQVSNFFTRLDHTSAVDFHFFPVLWQPGDLSNYLIACNSVIPHFKLSFSDPPFLDSPGNRGPPLFS